MKNIFIQILLIFLSIININGYQPVSELDLTKYDKTWYQVYGDNFDKLFENGSCIKANYQIIDSNNVSVLNTQINNNGKLEEITGFAYYKNNNTGGQLTVKLDGQNEAPYWVIELGPIVNDKYDYSIVSDNLKLSLFVLARDVEYFLKNYNQHVLESLKNFGFNNEINKPILTNQTNC